MNALIVSRVRNGETQEIVGPTAHQVTFKHFRRLGDCGFEGRQHGDGLFRQRDLDECLHAAPQRCRVEGRDIAGDDTGLLKQLDAAMARRSRQADAGTDLGD